MNKPGYNKFAMEWMFDSQGGNSTGAWQRFKDQEALMTMEEPGFEDGGRVAFDVGGTPESQIEKIIIDLYTNEKLGAQAISKRLKDDYGITLTRAPVGKRITKLVKEDAMKKITTKAFNISQRGDQYGKIKNNYRIVRPITDANRLQNPNLPADANFKVQVSRNGKVEQLYTKTKAEADNAVRDTTIKPVDPKPGKDKRAKTRRDRVKEVTKGSSEADKANIRTIEGGKKKLNLYFKNNPELINNSNFGKNIKAMLALRLDKDTGKVYSKIQDNSYYFKKAKQGQLFDLFDVNPVEGGRRGGRYATNVNIAPSTFNRAFAGAQLTNFFKKGINKDTTRSLDNLFKKYNLRLDLPNVGKIGATPGVAYDSKKGTFPTIDKTLKTLGAPKEVREFFIQKKNLANILTGEVDKLPKNIQAKICNSLSNGGLPGNCADAIKRDPIKTSRTVIRETKNLKPAIGARALSAGRTVLKFGVLGEAAFVGADTGVRAYMGRPKNEAFLAATFREGKADDLRKKRAGFTPREFLVDKATNLSNKINLLQQQIVSSEREGTNTEALENSVKETMAELQKPFEKIGTKLIDLLDPSSATNISYRQKMDNIMDSDRAKSMLTEGTARDVDKGIPNISDEIEIDAGVSKKTFAPRETLPSDDDYFRAYFQQIIPGMGEPRYKDIMENVVTPMDKFRIKSQDPRFDEQNYGASGKFASGGIAGILKK